MKQGLLFDLDGTLVDSLPGIAASLNHALEALSLPVHVMADVRRFIGNGSRMLARRAAWAVDEDTVDAVEEAFKSHYDANWQHGTTPYSGIPELLVALKERGHPLAVLSNKPHVFTEEIARRLFPQGVFKTVVGQKDGVPHKPDPAGALEIVRAFGMAASDCILIGDSTIDIETARNAGMKSIAVSWGYHDREFLEASGADELVDEATALATLLDGMK